MPGVLLEKTPTEGGASAMEVNRSAEETAQEKEKTKNDAPASRPVVGIIYPPPEVRSIQLF